jgi:iron complex outermembrane receptor protein
MSFKKSAITLASITLFAPIAFATQENLESNLSTVVQPITIYATRFEQSVDDSLPQTIIITDKEIQKSGLSNVSEVLQKVGGLTVKQNLDGSSNGVIDIRGFGDAADNNVLVLLDGIRLSENEQTSARTSLVPLEAIDHIEITRGGNSVLYGDGATGGTINIVTKSNLDDLTVVTAGVGSYSGLQSSVFHSRKSGEVNLTFFGRQNNNSGYRDNSGTAERSAGFSAINHLSGSDSIGMRATLSNERVKLPGALAISYLNTSPRSTEVPGYTSSAHVNTSSLTFFSTFRLKDDLQFKVDFNHSTKSNDWNYNYDASSVYSGYDPVVNPGQSPIAWGNTNSNSQTNSFSPRFKFDNFITPGGNLIAGYDRREYKRSTQAYKTDSDSSYYNSAFTSTNINDGSYGSQSFKSSGVYVRSELPISNRDTVIVGGRKQDFSQNSASNYYTGGNTASCTPGYCDPSSSSFNNSGSATAYEAQYNRFVQENLKGYLRASKSFRFANLDDNSQAQFSQNNNLSPQTSHDYEAGFTYQDHRFKSKFSLYESHLNNEIGFDGSNNVNFDPTKRQGIETINRYTVNAKLNLTGAVNLSESKFTTGQFSGKTVPGTSKITGSIGAQYQMSPKERLSWQTRISSNAYASGDMNNTQSQRAGYGVNDISYIYSESKWQIIGSVNNIFNKNYTDTAIYKSSYYPLYQLTAYPNPGRNFSLTGRYSF